MHQTIKFAIEQLSIAKQLKDEAETIRAEASKILIDYMPKHDLKTIDVPDLNSTLVYVDGTEAPKFNKNKAAHSLAIKGVPAETIQEVWRVSTDTTYRNPYVKLTPNKPNKRETA